METWKCNKCGATWCWLRGECPCCDGGMIRPQPEEEEVENDNIMEAKQCG